MFEMGGTGMVGLTTYMTRDRMTPCEFSIDDIFTIEDVIFCLHSIAQVDTSCDDLSSQIVQCVQEFGIREDSLARLSRMHIEYGADVGSYGYAINVMWSAIVYAIADPSGKVDILVPV